MQKKLLKNAIYRLFAGKLKSFKTLILYTLQFKIIAMTIENCFKAVLNYEKILG